MSGFNENPGDEKHHVRPATRGRPSSKKTQRLLAEFSRDTHYLEAHREELLREYENQWVAICNEEVIAADPDPEQIIAKVAKQELIGRAAIQFLTREEPFYFRPS